MGEYQTLGRCRTARACVEVQEPAGMRGQLLCNTSTPSTDGKLQTLPLSYWLMGPRVSLKLQDFSS